MLLGLLFAMIFGSSGEAEFASSLPNLKKDIYKGNVFFIGEVEFQRDKSGSVTGFKASNGRTKGIGFERL
jgi:hypothetical protein